jgi:hypothetical protein
MGEETASGPWHQTDGAGSFRFIDDHGNADKSLIVFYYQPHALPNNAPIFGCRVGLDVAHCAWRRARQPGHGCERRAVAVPLTPV